MKNDWKPIFRKKVIGAFLGVAIGDALGMPVEMMTVEDIKKKYGRVDRYIRPDGHRWFNGRDAGTWTNDWYFTKLVTESLIAKGKIDMDDMAKRHAEAYTSGDLKKYGAGGSTRKALKKLSEGVSYFESGTPGGAGNGLPMKVMPIGLKMLADFISINNDISDQFVFEEVWERYQNEVALKVFQLGAMTHQTAMAMGSGMAHVEATFVAFRPDPEYAFNSQFLNPIVHACHVAEGNFTSGGVKDVLSDAIEELNEEEKFKGMSVAEMAKMFGGATCYVFNSLPFCYGAFLYGNRKNIELIYDIASAGGDTDSNASIVGGLMGALYGVDIFPQHLIEGLWKKDEIIDMADRFWEKFFAKL